MADQKQIERDFDLNMNMEGLTPSVGGGGQFPVTGGDGNPAYHRARILELTREVNSRNTGMVVKVRFEGVSAAVQGLQHQVTINQAHEDPQVAKRGAQDMLALVYGALGKKTIGNSRELNGKEIGLTIRLDPGNKEGENYTRLDHFVFADGRDIFKDGQFMPFNVQAGNFGGGGQQQQNNGFSSGNNGGGSNGFSSGNQGQQTQDNSGSFNSGAQVRDQGNFNAGGNNGGGNFQQSSMPNPNGGQSQGQQTQGQTYGGPDGFNNGGQQQQQNGDRPNWSTGA